MSYEDIVVETTPSEATSVEETFITTTTAAAAAAKTNTEDKLDIRFYVTAVKCYLSLVIFLVNGVPLYTLKRYVQHINAVHLTIAYLALADICTGLQPWIKVVIIFIEHQNWGKGVCVFVAWLNFLCEHWKIQAITLIVVERYFLVARSNFHQKHFTPAKLKYVFAAGVTFIVVTMTAYIFTGNMTQKGGECCGIVAGKKTSIHMLFSSIFLAYTLVLIFSYIKIIIFIWKKKKITPGGLIVQNHNQLNKEKRTTILIMIIVSLHVATSSPKVLQDIILSNNPTKYQKYFGMVLSFLWFCNSILSPLIYTCKVPAFKEAYGKIFSRICLKRNENVVGVQTNVRV